MNKFGLLESEDEPEDASTFSDKLALFPPIKPRSPIDLAASDAAAAQHGFVSREAGNSPPPQPEGRRRRAIPSEPTRHLAIRLSATAYNNFVAYADRYQLTYHEALARLLDQARD